MITGLRKKSVACLVAAILWESGNASLCFGVEIPAPNVSLKNVRDGSLEFRVAIVIPEALDEAKGVTLWEFPFAEMPAEPVWKEGRWQKISGKANGQHKAKIEKRKDTHLTTAKATFARKGQVGEPFAALVQFEFKDREGQSHFSEPAALVAEIQPAYNDGLWPQVPLPDGAKENQAVKTDESFVRAECLNNGSRFAMLKIRDCIGTVWSPNGKHLYVLERPGTLRMLEAPSMKQKKVMKLSKEAKVIGMAAQGLVICSVSGVDVQIRVYDPETLEMKNELEEFEGPGAPFFSESSRTMIWVEGSRIVLMDLDGKKPARVHKLDALWAEITNNKGLTMRKGAFSPDGKSFYALSGDGIGGDGSIVSHKVGEDQSLEATSISPAKMGTEMRVAPNSKFLTVRSSSGLEGAPRARAFKVNDLTTPIATFNEADSPPVMFISARRYFARMNTQKNIGSFDANGRLLKSYSFRHFKSPLLKDIISPTKGTGMLIQASHDWFFFEPREQLEVGVQILQIGKPTAGKTELSGNWKKTVLPDFDGVPAWSADGTSLYCMSSTRENGNMLRRISFPDLIEEKRMHFDPISEVSLIGETKAGLVLNLRGKGAIWIIDPRTFEMVRKIDVLCNVKPSAFAISPGSDSIFVPARDCLLTIDAASGTVETAISFKSFPKSVYLPRYEEVELVSRRSGELLIAKTKSHLVEFAISAGKLSVSSSLSIERARGRPKWEPSGDVMTIPTVWALFPEQVTKSANPNYDSSKRGLYLVGEKDVTKPTGVYEGSAMIYRAPDGQSLHALSSEGLQILELNGQVRETIEFKNRFDRRGIPKAHPSLDVIAIGQKNGHSGMRIIQRVP